MLNKLNKEGASMREANAPKINPPIVAIAKGCSRSVPLPIPIAKGKNPTISALIVIIIGFSLLRVASATLLWLCLLFNCLDRENINIMLFTAIAKTSSMPKKAVLSRSTFVTNSDNKEKLAVELIAIIAAIAHF